MIMPHLLDTHTFLWMAADPSRLSKTVREIVLSEDTVLYLSAASGWEIALLRQLNRVELPDEPQRFIPQALQRLKVLPLPIGFPVAISAAMLPFLHRDPFDRIIIAEAIKHKMTVLTKDEMFKKYGIDVVW